MCIFKISHQLWHIHNFLANLSIIQLRIYTTNSSITNTILSLQKLSGLRAVTSWRVSLYKQLRPALPDRSQSQGRDSRVAPFGSSRSVHPPRVCPSLEQKPLHNGGKCHHLGSNFLLPLGFRTCFMILGHVQHYFIKSVSLPASSNRQISVMDSRHRVYFFQLRHTFAVHVPFMPTAAFFTCFKGHFISVLPLEIMSCQNLQVKTKQT